MRRRMRQAFPGAPHNLRRVPAGVKTSRAGGLRPILTAFADGPSRHTHPYKQPAEPKGSFNYGCPWTGRDPGDRADCDATQSPRVPYLERNSARWSHPHFFYLAAETDSVLQRVRSWLGE